MKKYINIADKIEMPFIQIGLECPIYFLIKLFIT